MSRRNYIQGEKLQQQNEYLESQNTELQKTLNELDEKHKSLGKKKSIHTKKHLDAIFQIKLLIKFWKPLKVLT
jgi:hypothetical protein